MRTNTRTSRNWAINKEIATKTLPNRKAAENRQNDRKAIRANSATWDV